MKVKTCSATIKAAGAHEGTEEGVFEAVVAAYNVDSVGDRIIPGAFKNTLADWQASGNPIPVIWSHKSDDPEYHIGFVEQAEERAEGLWVRGRLDMDDAKSAKVYRLLKGRRVTNFSFAYDEIDARPAEEKSGAEKDLHELKVYEVGPCLVGCNQETSLLAVKVDPAVVPPTVPQLPADPAKGQPATQNPEDAAGTAGRVLSKETEEALRSVLADLTAKLGQVGELLAGVSGPPADVPQASPSAPADSPPVEATETAPAPEGTASAHQPDVLMALALLEAEQGAYTI